MIYLNDEEFEELTKAKETKDWKSLSSSKLRYAYLRGVAIPSGDMQAVKEISEMARAEIRKKDIETNSFAQSLFEKNKN